MREKRSELRHNLISKVKEAYNVPALMVLILSLAKRPTYSEASGICCSHSGEVILISSFRSYLSKMQTSNQERFEFLAPSRGFITRFIRQNML